MTASGNDAMPTRDEQASAWCVRLSTGSLGHADQAAFDRWLKIEPGNAVAFDRALTIWQGLHAISDTPEMIARRANALEALRRANVRRWSRPFGGGWQRGIALAASLLLILASSLLLFGARPKIYATAMGERRALLLADGSRLSLDAETKVSVLLERDHRALTLLAGRAKFEVARDERRPFTVTAGNRTIIATGTAFSVELIDRQVHVIVYEGRVAVVEGNSPPSAQLLSIKVHPGVGVTSLSPGRELISDVTADAPAEVVYTDVARSLSWEGGQLNFVDEPLPSAIERLNRYSATKIVLGDHRLAAILVNGVFNAGDPTAFAEALSEAYPLRVERGGGNDLVLVAKPS